MKKRTRKYEKKLDRQLSTHQDFLVKRLSDEWDLIQKTAKREELVRRTKAGVAAASKTLLILLAVGGVVTVALVAPKAFGAYARLTRRRGFFGRRDFNRAKSYLSRRNYIRVHSRDKDSFEINITKSGTHRILRESFKTLSIPVPKSWDGVWRMIVFDIPNRHKGARDGFRMKLKSLGFYPLQESVFVLPYQCENEVRFLVSIFSIGPYVHFIVTSHISNDQTIKEHFDLV